MNLTRMRYGLGILLLLFVTSIWAQIVIPELTQRVTDSTQTLSATQRASLEEKLAAFEAKKGSQIAVLIVPTTQPLDIAEYGIQVADLQQIGRKGVDDGVIFIIAKNDHKLRFEVGRGLEGVIPDVIAKRIIVDIVTPYFKSNNFAGGIDAGITQLMQLIDSEALPTPKGQIIGHSDENIFVTVGEGSYLFVLMAGLFVGSLLTTVFGRVLSGLIAGIGSAAIVTSLFGLSVAVIIIGFLVFFIISMGNNGGGWSNGGGFGRGGNSSWGRSGSSSWSGGGGGFGGGGASGSW